MSLKGSIKKRIIRARNRKHHEINLLEETHRAEEVKPEERVAEYVAALAEESAEERRKQMLATLAARKARSMNKWNRFAGTGGAGGRGL